MIEIQKVYLEQNQKLTKDQILDYVNDFDDDEILDNEDYFKGDNPTILDREDDTMYEDDGTPNERIAIPYGRKIITTISGYMYKPGFITYSSENEQYMELIQDNQEQAQLEFEDKSHVQSCKV